MGFEAFVFVEAILYDCKCMEASSRPQMIKKISMQNKKTPFAGL
jgi:hypothetical protein